MSLSANVEDCAARRTHGEDCAQPGRTKDGRNCAGNETEHAATVDLNVSTGLSGAGNSRSTHAQRPLMATKTQSGGRVVASGQMTNVLVPTSSKQSEREFRLPRYASAPRPNPMRPAPLARLKPV